MTSLTARFSKYKICLAALILFIAAIILRVSISEVSHILFWDELIIHTVAHKISINGFNQNFDKLPFFSALVAGFNSIFDALNYGGIYVNILFSAATVVVNFLWIRRFNLPVWIVLFHSLLWLCSPNHIVWTQTAEPNIAALFFVSLFFLKLQDYFETPSLPAAIYVVLSATFAGLMRLELFLLFSFIIYAFLATRQTLPLKKSTPLLFIPILFFSFIYKAIFYYLTFTWNQLGSVNPSARTNFSFENIVYNLESLWYRGLITIEPVFLWVFVFIGTISIFKSQRKLALCLTVFIFVYGVLFYGIWLETLTLERIFLTFLPILYLLVSLGLHKTEQTIQAFKKAPWAVHSVKLIAIVALTEIPLQIEFINIEKDPEKVLMTKVPTELRKDLPKNSRIIVHNTSSLDFVPAFQLVEAKHALSEPIAPHGEQTKDDIYYLEDITCSKRLTWLSEPYLQDCEYIKNHWDLEEVKRYQYKSATISLFKVKSRSSTD